MIVCNTVQYLFVSLPNFSILSSGTASAFSIFNQKPRLIAVKPTGAALSTPSTP